MATCSIAGSCTCFSALIGNRRRYITLVLIGLDNAGKTTLLSNIRREFPGPTVPTWGFVSRKWSEGQFDVTFYDLGGSANIRRIWEQYYAEVHGGVFVVDASDRSRLHEARDLLLVSMSHPYMLGKPFLIFANKQDVCSALTDVEVALGLNLKVVEGSKHLVVPCSAHATCPTGQGQSVLDERIWVGLRWLLGMIERDFVDLDLRAKQEGSHVMGLEIEAQNQRRASVRKRKASLRLESQAEQKGIAEKNAVVVTGKDGDVDGSEIFRIRNQHNFVIEDDSEEDDGLVAPAPMCPCSTTDSSEPSMSISPYLSQALASFPPVQCLSPPSSCPTRSNGGAGRMRPPSSSAASSQVHVRSPSPLSAHGKPSSCTFLPNIAALLQPKLFANSSSTIHPEYPDMHSQKSVSRLPPPRSAWSVPDDDSTVKMSTEGIDKENCNNGLLQENQSPDAHLRRHGEFNNGGREKQFSGDRMAESTSTSANSVLKNGNGDYMREKSSSARENLVRGALQKENEEQQTAIASQRNGIEQLEREGKALSECGDFEHRNITKLLSSPTQLSVLSSNSTPRLPPSSHRKELAPLPVNIVTETNKTILPGTSELAM